jgi:Domain of unknown function (DUF1707)/Cell wall-active antibiotics response 4TMS YvqF
MHDNNWMDPQDFNANSRLRASDADRDTAAAVINNALAEGRLTAEEHSERLDAIYAAKTQADLVPLLDDLPAQRAAMAQSAATSADMARVRWGSRGSRGSRIVAIFSGATRKGNWHAEPVMSALAVFGGIELDFRDAILPGQEVVLHATAVMGGIEITVPPEMRVVDNGIAILGGRDITGNVAESAGPDSPVLRIEGACVMGGVEVSRKPRKPPKSLRGRGRAAIGLAGAAGLEAVLDEVRDRHREIRDEVREHRRDLHRQMHERRREARRHWTDRDY